MKPMKFFKSGKNHFSKKGIFKLTKQTSKFKNINFRGLSRLF